MAKYIEVDSVSGNMQEVIGLETSTGVPDANKIPETGTDGRLSVTLMPVGIGPDTKSIVASEDLDSGDQVNVWDDAGTLKARKATNITVGKQSEGFVLDAALSGASALVYFEGVNTAHSGLTLAKTYFLGLTGLVTDTPPTAAGSIVQKVGKSISATEIAFEATNPITLA